MYIVTAAHEYLSLTPNWLWLITHMVSALLADCYHQAPRRCMSLPAIDNTH